MRRVAINGFGRIGRSFVRAALERKELGRDFEIVAINDLADKDNLTYLLRFDSVQHTLRHDIRMNGNKMMIDDISIEILSKANPRELPWKDMKIDTVIESTGYFTQRTKAKAHLDAGARKVLISAPSSDADISIVVGVNHKLYDPGKHDIVSNASCTTNSLAPPVKILHENFGIEMGLMTTVHAYTQNQRILDFPDAKDWRRGRAGALSIIPTSSGASEAIAQILPELTGRINGAALRVPVPVGSVTDFTATLKNEVTVDQVNDALKRSSQGSLKGIMGYTDDPIVSADIIGDPHSAVIDGKSTLVAPEPGKMVKILSWYDNEYGYANRLVDLVSRIL